MRKCWLAALFALWICALSGCGLLRSFYQPGPNGEPSTASTVQGIVRSLPYGEIIASIIGLGGLAVGTERHLKKTKADSKLAALQAKHDALLAAGKKDDNSNGIDDALEPTPPAPPVS